MGGKEKDEGEREGERNKRVRERDRRQVMTPKKGSRVEMMKQCTIHDGHPGHTHAEGSLSRGTDGCVNRRLCPIVLDVWVGSTSKELPHILPLGVGRCKMEGRVSQVACGVQITSSGNQSGDRAIDGGEVARRHSILLPRHYTPTIAPGEERGVFSHGGIPRRVRAATAAKWHARHVHASDLRLFHNGQHQRGVPTGSRGIHVYGLSILHTVLVEKLLEELGIAEGVIVKVVPLAGIATSLSDNSRRGSSSSRG